ncbi:MAG: efflux RND transporter periplasmic adaptor subunit [Pirellulaceae bacterium]
MKQTSSDRTSIRVHHPAPASADSTRPVEFPQRVRGRSWILVVSVLVGVVCVVITASLLVVPGLRDRVSGAVSTGFSPATPGHLNDDQHEAHNEPAEHGHETSEEHAAEHAGGDAEAKAEASPAKLHQEAGHAEDEHPGHLAEESLSLSAQAIKNVGLTLWEVTRSDFHRSVRVPAVIVERAGRSEITVSAPLTGIVTRIHPIPGAAVSPGDALVDLRLTHEDLVEKQSDLLRNLEQLDVINQEVSRLQEVARSGAVPGKRLLEPIYEKQKLEGAMRAEHEALLLHGLTEEQINTIERDRRLVKSIVVYAPQPDESHLGATHGSFFQIAALAAKRGEHVATGTVLMTLTDHCELYIEGRAFEQDAAALHKAANAGTPVSALIEADGADKREVSGLRILYVDSVVDQESRALKFYLRLPNELLRDESTPEGHRFVAWRYKPGQRVEVLVPVETWPNVIVLPVEAVIPDGPDWYVYQKNANHFDRIAVHVQYRDQRGVVVDGGGRIKPGDVVAASGAYQLHLALTNKAGGGMDPHAGHNH